MADRGRSYRLYSWEKRRSAGGPEADFWSNSTNRYLVSLLASIGLILGIIHVPIERTAGIGWRSSPSTEPTSFDLLPPEYSKQPVKELLDFSGGVPVTDFGKPEEAKTVSEEGSSDNPTNLAARSDSLSGIRQRPRKTRVRDLEVLQFAEEQPEIIGGLNSLYLRIRYPKAAQESGIEGLVLVSFIVETDGTTSDIRVLEPLHPLCDKAVVDAIGETPFTPARQNGKRVRVRMHLPIRFVLIDDPTGLMVDHSEGVPET